LLQARGYYLDMLAKQAYSGCMNRLSVAKRVRIVAALIEGGSANATRRISSELVSPNEARSEQKEY
jgi:hypothetical protein